MVILENAVFPPRESQKSLDGKVGDRKGGSRSNEMQTKTQGLARLFSDLAKAAVMKKSVSPISNGLGKSSGGQATLARGWASVDPGSSHPGQVFGFSGVSCPDATLGLFSGVSPKT